MKDTNNILSLLDSYTLDNGEDIAKEVAYNFRKRRIEKNLTRDQVAELAGVAVSNIVRFEQKGLISLKNLIGIAMALGYTSEVRSLFAQQKYSTMEELTPDNKLCAFEYAPSWLVEGLVLTLGIAVAPGLVFGKAYPLLRQLRYLRGQVARWV